MRYYSELLVNKPKRLYLKYSFWQIPIILLCDLRSVRVLFKHRGVVVDVNHTHDEGGIADGLSVCHGYLKGVL